MNIGIFSKIDMAGGSEFRCAELANSVARHTRNRSFLLAEKSIPQRILDYLDPSVEIKTDIFASAENAKILYDMDSIIVINTDATCFTKADYWEGKSERHGTHIDLCKIKQFLFLFNFIVNPARHLCTIEPKCQDIRIASTNSKFFNEISSQDRYENVRHLPRIILESPINSDLLTTEKTISDKVRFGMHSKSMDDKWNSDWPKLIKQCNERIGDKIQFDFMGTSRSVADKLKEIPNVTVRKENSMSVREYLKGIDVFTFFPSWSREEPWSRVVAEAMTSGCPVFATKKGGNIDQVIHGNNGYLCDKADSFFNNIVSITQSSNTRYVMGRNSYRLSKRFESKAIIAKLMEFIA